MLMLFNLQENKQNMADADVEMAEASSSSSSTSVKDKKRFEVKKVCA